MSYNKQKYKKYAKILKFNIMLLLIAFVVTVVSIITGSYVTDKENIQVGSVSPKRYIATRDVENIFATQKLKDEAIKSVTPLYKHDSEVENKTVSEVEEFFVDVNNVILNKQKSGLDGNNTSWQETKESISALKLPVVLSDKQYDDYAALSPNSKARFQQELLELLSYTYEQGLTEDSKEKVLVQIKDKLSQSEWESSLVNLGYLVMSAAIEPNLVLDEEAMIVAKEQKAAQVQPVIIRKDQKIVDEGEIITEEIFNVLNNLNLIINNNHNSNVMPILGTIIVVAFLFLASFVYLCEKEKLAIVKSNEMLILFTAYVISIFILRAMASMTMYTLLPLSMFAMIVSIFIGTRLAVVLNVFMAITGIFIFNGDLAFAVYFIITGTFSAIFMQYTYNRNHIFVVMMGMGIVDFTTGLAVGLFFQNGYTSTLFDSCVYGGLIGILSVIVVIGSLPVWEAVFGVDTPIKLMELTNPDNELMRRLMIEAPGTYHHSLIVANLAETAAYDINANPTQARVGAYFHDIGKLKFPLFFSENQTGGENRHDSISPLSSARLIKEHVIYGKELANEYKLPNVVKSIILEHHGNTLIKYFFVKAKKSDENGSVDENDFRYEGSIPQSKESAIVMLADTVEAAVRSNISHGKNFNEIQDIIRNLIKDKLDDGQLDESGLKISDLTIIRKSFLNVFQGMYHDRIAYPKDEEIKNALNKKKEGEKSVDSDNGQQHTDASDGQTGKAD